MFQHLKKKKKASRWYVSNISHFFKSEPKRFVYNNLKWIIALNSDSVRFIVFYFKSDLSTKPNQPSDLTTQMLKETSHLFFFGPCQCCSTTAQRGDASAIAQRAKLQSGCVAASVLSFPPPQ